MRRLVIVGIILLMAFPSVFAARKKDKSGKVTDGVYTDKKYDFQFTINDGWKYKTQKNKNNYRLVLTQKNYQIPSYYMQAEDYTLVPRLVVWGGETDMSPAAFVDSLLSDSYNSDQKKDLYKEFELIAEGASSSGTYREKLVPRGKKTIELGGEKGFFWKGNVKYMKEVALSASSSGGKRVNGAYGGGIVAVKNDKMIVVFHFICEWVYYQQVEAEVLEMIHTLKWGDPGAEG